MRILWMRSIQNSKSKIQNQLPDLLVLIAQIAVILVAARAAGAAFRRLGQPQVVGEMAAGILLGPSLLGWLAPGLSQALFPSSSLGFLNSISQVGLLLFMFLVGLELDTGALRRGGRTAVVASHASIAAPFALGVLLALYLYPRLSSPGVPLGGFALFMGAAMSVTAFPVLARILTERGLLRTRLGALTIACAAVDDVTAWCILAGIVVLVRSGEEAFPLWLTLAGSAVFVAAMVFAVKPALGRFEAFVRGRGGLTHDGTAFVILLVLASAWVTEWLGIHALFGAFLAGAIMPRAPDLARDLAARFESVTVVLFLPIFFAFTGLRTSVGLVSGAEMWLYCALIVAVAVAGKLGGSAVAARATGLPWREATALGVLMNTRGLMELVILNIGLDIGVISPALFSMMVVMALVTTVMTTPLLAVVYPARMVEREAAARPEPASAPEGAA
jgi:Kef-type K+ transport system membrane component KefB